MSRLQARTQIAMSIYIEGLALQEVQSIQHLQWYQGQRRLHQTLCCVSRDHMPKKNQRCLLMIARLLPGA